MLLLAALAEGETTITNLLDSDDTRVMLAALESLGVKLKLDGDECVVAGTRGAFTAKTADLFLGNAGTAMRPLTAALAVNGGEYRVHGVPRMHERPIGDLVDGLRQIGARIEYEENEGFPPLRIRPAQIAADAPIRVRGDVSSQFLTALLMTLPLVRTENGATTVEVDGELISKPYIDITIKLMERFGILVERDGPQRFVVPAGAALPVAGADHGGGRCVVGIVFPRRGRAGWRPGAGRRRGRASIQGDVGFASALMRMGANVSMGDDWIEVRGVGRDDGKLEPLDMDFNLIPDAAMTIAIAGLFADGATTLRNIGSWRVKETDRIAAMATELRKVGAKVQEGDRLPHRHAAAKLLPNAAIDTYDDHRMAMCFSLVSLGRACRCASTIRNASARRSLIISTALSRLPEPDVFFCDLTRDIFDEIDPPFSPDARHHDRRPHRFRQRHGGRPGRRHSRVSSAGQRGRCTASPRSPACVTTCPSMTPTRWRRWSANFTLRSAKAWRSWTASTFPPKSAPRRSATGPPRLLSMHRCAPRWWRVSGLFARSPGWSLTAATWARQSFPTPYLRYF